MVVKDVVVVAAAGGITVFVSEAKSFCFANVCWLITFFDMYCVTVFFFYLLLLLLVLLLRAQEMCEVEVAVLGSPYLTVHTAEVEFAAFVS